MKRNIAIAVVTAAVLAGGGTVAALAVAGDDGRDGGRGSGAAAAEDRRDDDRHDGGDDRRGDDGDDRAEAPVRVQTGAAGAVAAALRHTPGTAVSVELDEDGDGRGDDDGRDRDERDDRGGGRDDDRGGRAVWEVGVLSGDGSWRTLRVDPSTGRVTGDRADVEDDAAGARAALDGARVSAAEAARAVAGKGTVTSVDLDDDRDAAWKVATRDGRGDHEWRVDLRSGRVTPDRSDDD